MEILGPLLLFIAFILACYSFGVKQGSQYLIFIVLLYFIAYFTKPYLGEHSKWLVVALLALVVIVLKTDIWGQSKNRKKKKGDRFIFGINRINRINRVRVIDYFG